ncbi:hypothetical protein ONZ45_g1258 [Pleurotus djamor]|nr:hypothetical protein ONZ45_g1258 [Pleurotus djamor]
MGRWTQYDGDDYRLPDGFKRVGYDADRAVYTFKDRYGRLYEGYPHQEYGTLKPIGQSSSKSHTLYEKESSTAPNLLPKPRLETTGPSPKSFSDILSPDKITSASPTSETTKIDPKSRFVNAVWRATRPKMQNVVENVMKRSTASREADKDSIYEKLLPDDRRRSSDSIPSMSEHKSSSWNGTIIDNPLQIFVYVFPCELDYARTIRNERIVKLALATGSDHRVI